MKLTHRQSAVMAALLDLYGEYRGPVSYRLVAERLEVAPATAYRMLRLAEAKGYVEARYERTATGGRTGRRAVRFAPTDLARHRLAELAGSLLPAGLPRGPQTDRAATDRAATDPASTDPAPSAEAASVADWEAARSRILAAVADPAALPDALTLRGILAALDEPASPLERAGRTIAASMLELEEAGRPADELLARLADRGSRLTVATLGGLLIGLAAADEAAGRAGRAGRGMADRLERRVDAFAEALTRLSPEEEIDLARFAAQLGGLLQARRLKARRLKARRPNQHPTAFDPDT